MNSVAVPDCFLQRLENEHDPALGAHIAVGLFGEGPAKAGGGEHAGLGKADETEGSGEDIDAADQSRVDLAAGKRVARFVEGDQRGRAGRVNGETRPG